MNRWHAVVRYRSEQFPAGVDVPHDIEELEELQDIVERGPDWHTIENITITLQRKVSGELTLEEADRR